MTDTGGADNAPPFASDIMIVELRLTDFRNYGSAAIAFDSSMVVLTGENGAGKTNLMEAVSLLAPGRGLRRSSYAEMVRGGARDGFAVFARLRNDQGETEIGTGYRPADDTSRRVRIDGSDARSSDELLDHLRVMWLTPAMDGLFTGSAGDRRRFLDRMVLTVDPGHGRRSLDYEKAMRGRNRLLAEGSRDSAWLGAIEAQLAETGIAIAAARLEAVRLLSDMIARVPDDGPFPQARIAIEGRSEALVAEHGATDAEDRLRELLADGRERDRAAGRTLEGPHRSDLSVLHRPKAMPAALCSTGEQKALLVGLILSQARLVAETTGLRPILLLDEIAAHFDSARRRSLFGILRDLGSQVFMTGTEPSLFAEISKDAQFLVVTGGEVEDARR